MTQLFKYVCHNQDILSVDRSAHIIKHIMMFFLTIKLLEDCFLSVYIIIYSIKPCLF